jgi:general secretion pathway protein B
MSYILDALKKAERERGIAHVPTLATVHELRAKSSVRLWAVSGLSIVCIGAALWFFLVQLKRDHRASPSSNTEVSAPVTNSPASELMGQPASAGRSPSAAHSPESLSASHSEVAGGTAGSTARMNPVAIPPPATETLTETPLIAGYGSDAGARHPTQSNVSATISPAGENSPGGQPAATAENSSSRQSVMPSRSGEAKPAAAGAQAKPLTLREAMSTMTMSILSYSENKADRLVFINGRKYIEGDYVEDRYLLESITPEGAVLSYNGERAVLQPGSK